jgi:glycosyltransferase involved in cell wall biosynthesis
MPIRIAVVIPALDEAESLPGVLADLPLVYRRVVVDNGSIDDTAARAVACGAEVVFEPRRGYGSAVQAGLRALADDPPDIVVILDADHADRPELLERLVAPIRRGEADIVLSDRTRSAEPGALQPTQRFGNWLATRLMRVTTGHRYADMGPFRAVRWSSLQRLQLEDATWGWNVEMQMKAVHHHLRILEVPLPYRPRRAGKSTISGSLRGSARAGWRILRTVARYRAPSDS